jgi:hypothetical protein
VRYSLIPILLTLFAAALYGGGTGAKPWLDRLDLGTGFRWVGLALALIGLFAALALLTLGAIVVGFVNDEPWLVSAACVFAALHMVARFLDTEWPTLQRGLVFAAAGLGALGLAAALERRRAA